MSSVVNAIRKITPLSCRRLFGPYIGYVVYFYRTRIRKRTWEPIVLSPLETLEKIKDEELSILRFGDGELSLLSGIDLGFQKYSPELGQALENTINQNQPKLLIGIPGIFGHLEHFAKTGFWFEIHHLFRYSNLWQKVTSPNRIYGDAFITRPYLSYKDKSNAAVMYDKIKSLWADRDVVLIEGEKSRLGVGNDLFAEARTIKRILGPAEDAYSKANVIIEEVLKLPKNHLILLSLGPAAKVIGYALFSRGYRVIDVGHLDMEYEMYLLRSDKLIEVPYKYFNEINARNPEECNDQTYQDQIIARIIT